MKLYSAAAGAAVTFMILNGGFGGFKGCSMSSKPKFEVGDCVQHQDKESWNKSIETIIEIGKNSYRTKYCRRSDLNSDNQVTCINSELGFSLAKYYVKVDCGVINE